MMLWTPTQTFLNVLLCRLFCYIVGACVCRCRSCVCVKTPSDLWMTSVLFVHHIWSLLLLFYYVTVLRFTNAHSETSRCLSMREPWNRSHLNSVTTVPQEMHTNMACTVSQFQDSLKQQFSLIWPTLADLKSISTNPV